MLVIEPDPFRALMYWTAKAARIERAVDLTSPTLTLPPPSFNVAPELMVVPARHSPKCWENVWMPAPPMVTLPRPVMLP